MPPKTAPPSGSSASSSEHLKGWKEIASFLGLPISAAQRWAKSGMPITREGQRVRASADELNRWMGRESSEPVHIATESADLSSELRRGLSYVKKQKQARNQARNKEKAA